MYTYIYMTDYLPKINNIYKILTVFECKIIFFETKDTWILLFLEEHYARNKQLTWYNG